MIRSFKTSLFYIAFGASFSLLFPPINYASESTLTCSNDEGFLSVFKVNKRRPSVTHISSYDPNSNERFSVNSKFSIHTLFTLLQTKKQTDIAFGSK